ncbi:MAG: hypothetical protein EOO45_00440 [Flavobacterium sp.]|nr:MAG: hypothetical protein EOO45_00440 [Flavobacterium sp.]
MKIVDAAKIMDIARIISLVAMLAYMALLFIRFMSAYLANNVHYFSLQLEAMFGCPYARKRTAKKIVHNCKNAVFTKSPDSLAGLSGKRILRYRDAKGVQRGLLKDKA